MRPLRTAVILVELCVLCGWFLGQAAMSTSGAQEAETGPPADQPQVWVEAIFVQVDTADLDRAKASTGATLDPQSGSVILDGEEKAKLLAELKRQPSFELIGSASLITLSGQEAHVQMVEQIRYPKEYKAEGAAQSKDGPASPPVILPREFDQRNAGISLYARPVVLPDGKRLSLTIEPEASFPAGWVNFGSKAATQPVFTSWSLRTTIILRDGTTMVLPGVPTKNFEQSIVLNPTTGQKPKGTKSSLLLISAKIIKPGKGK